MFISLYYVVITLMKTIRLVKFHDFSNLLPVKDAALRVKFPCITHRYKKDEMI